MRLAAILLFLVASSKFLDCEAFGIGSLSAFGYDASSACGKTYPRLSRARIIEKLPCDFRRQNWCTIAGNSYPWHAVRRFVQENQGLMRRMYGDERHISILKAEFEKNDIELDDEEEEHFRFSDARNFRFNDENEFDYLFKQDARQGRGFVDKSKMEGPASQLFNSVENPQRTQSPITSTPSTTTVRDTEPSQRTKMTRVTEQDNIETTLSSINSTIVQSSSIASTSSELPTTTHAPTLAEIANVQNFSINEIPGQIDRLDVDLEDLAEIVVVQKSTYEQNATSTSTPSSSERISNFEEPSRHHIQSIKDTTSSVDHESLSIELQQFRPRPEYKPTETKAEATNIEGQLYQDVAGKDQPEPEVFKFRGINACPVKEEVVAPFWANNTRGEILALLNLYPFEQYVHWEKCTDPDKQMYCRDGCKCEQQYRLHRLLAYDPNNECRGIFSDWFKFPSCCICKCYDLPIEFRMTSRSPRLQKSKVKIKSSRKHQRNSAT